MFTLVWPIAILVAALWAARRLGWLVGNAEAPISWADLPLALGSGLFLALITEFWLVPFHVQGGPIIASDMHEFCLALEQVRQGHWEHWNFQRSLTAGVLPGLLSHRYGIVDALLISSLLDEALTGFALYVWARSLHGRTAGLAAVLMAAATAPLVIPPRIATFYPALLAGFVLSAAFATLALRVRRPWAVALGAIGASLGFLIDLRGFTWGLAALGLTLLAAVQAPGPGRRGPPPKRGLLRPFLQLGLVAGIIFLAWEAGRLVYLPQTTPLEHHAMVIRQSRERDLGTKDPPWEEIHAGYRWGYGSPLEMLSTARNLERTIRETPDAARRLVRLQEGRRQYVIPWAPLFFLSLAPALWGLRRHPLRMAGLLVTLLPFVMALLGLFKMQFEERFLMLAAPILPLVVGVGFGAVAEGGSAAKTAGLRSFLLPVCAVLGLLALVLGLIPSPLSPKAAWQVPFAASEQLRAIVMLATDRENPAGGRPLPPLHASDMECSALIRDDISSGRAIGLLGWMEW